MIWIVMIGFLGLCVGSFLNVVIYRLPILLRQQWSRAHGGDLQEEASYNLCVPRSHCPQCQHRLSLSDNIPLFSYYFLKGRCRYCKTAISRRYPVIEGLTACLSVWVAWRFGMSVHAGFGLLFTWFLITLSAIDYDEMLLHDQLTIPLVWLGLLSSLLPHSWISPKAAILGAVLGYLILWSLYWIFKAITRKEGMGYGDFKLCAALGACLGWQALPLVLLIASTLGTVIGLIQILLKYRRREDPLPFGPFLAFAGWIHFIWF